MDFLASTAALALVAQTAAQSASAGSGTFSVTPHASYSSSIGVLGCKIDYNRVAYWPMEVDCDSMCVKLTYQGNSMTVLHVDHSGGAYDISYDAWSRLYCGVPGTDQTCIGGGVDMEYEWVDMSQCSDILSTGKLPFSAANSMNTVSACLGEASSFTAKNYELYNIADTQCSLGVDEECTLDWPAANQPTCPSMLGIQTSLTSDPVWNINYPNAALPVTSLAMS